MSIKSIYNFKALNTKKIYWSLFKFAILVVTFILINEAINSLLNIKRLLQNFLSDFLTQREINIFFEFQDKWIWLTYLYIPTLLLLKISIVTLTLYIGLFFENKNIKFKALWNIVLDAEFIFLLVPISKIIWFSFFQPDYTLLDIQNFYPLSALSIVGYKNLETWFIYLFQTLNLFELSYVIYIAFQLGKLTNTNADYGLKIVGLSYIPFLLLWIATVMFFTLNYS